VGIFSRIEEIVNAAADLGKDQIEIAFDTAAAVTEADDFSDVLGAIKDGSVEAFATGIAGTIGPEGVVGEVIEGLPMWARGAGNFYLDTVETLGREYIREPITTGFTASSLATAAEEGPVDNPLTLFKPKYWKQAHEIAQVRSPGQAFALMWLTDDITDPDEIARWEGTVAFKLFSGTGDLVLRWRTEPDLMLAKTIRLLRGSTIRARTLGASVEGVRVSKPAAAAVDRIMRARHGDDWDKVARVIEYEVAGETVRSAVTMKELAYLGGDARSYGEAMSRVRSKVDDFIEKGRFDEVADHWESMTPTLGDSPVMTHLAPDDLGPIRLADDIDAPPRSAEPGGVVMGGNPGSTRPEKWEAVRASDIPGGNVYAVVDDLDSVSQAGKIDVGVQGFVPLSVSRRTADAVRARMVLRAKFSDLLAQGKPREALELLGVPKHELIGAENFSVQQAIGRWNKTLAARAERAATTGVGVEPYLPIRLADLDDLAQGASKLEVVKISTDHLDPRALTAIGGSVDDGYTTVRHYAEIITDDALRAELRIATPGSQVEHLAGRIKKVYFPNHGEGDLIAHELAMALIGTGGYSGGRESARNVLRFFALGERSALAAIAVDSPAAAARYNRFLYERGAVKLGTPPGQVGGYADDFNYAQHTLGEQGAPAIRGEAEMAEHIAKRAEAQDLLRSDSATRARLEAAQDAAPAAAPGVIDEPRWHGSPAMFDEFDVGGHGRPFGLFGNGVYTTDDLGLAVSYSRTGRPNLLGYQFADSAGGTVHNVVWGGKRPPRVLDVEAPMPDDVRDVARRFAASFGESGLAHEVPVDSLDELRRILDSPDSTYEQFYNQLTEIFRESGVPVAELVDDVEALRFFLIDAGIDALRHTGGLRRGGGQRLHEVTVWLDDSSVKISQSETVGMLLGRGDEAAAGSLRFQTGTPKDELHSVLDEISFRDEAIRMHEQAVRNVDTRVGPAVRGAQSLTELPIVTVRKRLGDAASQSVWLRTSRLAAPVRVLRDMRPHGSVYVGDANGGDQMARQLKEAGFSPDEITRVRGEWASTPHLDRVELVNNIQARIIDRVVREHFPDIKQSQIDDLIDDFRRSSDSAAAAIGDGKNHLYDAGMPGTETGVAWMDPDSGQVIQTIFPLTPSQLRQTVPLLDVKKLDKFLKARAGGWRRRGLYEGGELHNSAMDFFHSEVWKPAVLLRSAWPLVVIGDEQVRMMAKLGTINRVWDLLVEDRPTYVQAVLRRAATSKTGSFDPSDLGKLSRRRAARSAVVGGAVFGFPGAAVAGGLSLARNRRNIRLLTARVGRESEAARYADMGEEALARSILAREGTENLHMMGYDVQGPHGDVLAPQEMWHKSVSANRSLGYHFLDRERQFARDNAEALGDWTRIYSPGDADYGRWWERVVNDQWANNEFGRLFFDNTATDADIVEWLAGSKGQEMLRALPHLGDDPEMVVRGLRDITDRLIGRTDEMADLRTRLARGDRVKFDDLRAAGGKGWKDHVGAVHAQETLSKGKNKGWALVQEQLNSVFERMMTLPTDNLSRNPYFQEMYLREMQRRFKIIHGTQGDEIEITAAALREIEDSARRVALNETRHLLYDLAEGSQFADIVRYISPFFNAYQEVLTRWAGLSVENPAFMARMALTFRSGFGLPVTENEDGDKFIVFRIPEQFKAALEATGSPLKGAFEDVGSIRVRVDSLNMLAQGPIPGFGPYATIPASILGVKEPEIGEALGFVLPYGPSDILESIQPAWIKRLTQMGFDDEKFQFQTATILLTRMADMANGERDPIDFSDGAAVTALIEDAKADSRRLSIIRAFTSFTVPATLTYHSPYQPWMDRYRELKNENPASADEKFMKELLAEGDEGFFAMSQRFTKTNDGLPATLESEYARQEYIDLIRKYPDIGGLIIGLEGGGAAQWSAFVYDRQKREETSPGSGMPRREYMSLLEIITDVRVREGWVEYVRMNDLVYGELRRRGLPNLQVSEAKDLNVMRQAAIAGLGRRFPLWFDVYRDPDQTKWPDRIEGMRAVIADRRLSGRDDIRLLARYFRMRDVLTKELSRRSKLPGGAASLTAVTNLDVKTIWDAGVDEMLKNPAFMDVWSRWLEFDPVSVETWPESQRPTILERAA